MNWSLTEGPRIRGGEKIMSLTDGAEKTGYAHAKKIEIRPFPYTIHRIHSK